MQAVFDVVDLLQLQEIWVRRSITQAYSRLERRTTMLPCPFEFNLKVLMPRLGQLRNASAWRLSKTEKRTDPAQLPLCALTDPYLEILFPDVVPIQARQQLFLSVYHHFVVSQYRGATAQACGLLRALADLRSVELGYCLDAEGLPVVGSNYWIPVDLTDEIRGLDVRYNSAQPDTPATYVVDDDFWLLLVKAEPDDLAAAVARYCDDPACIDDGNRRLRQLVELAGDWNRSSSVVGLYYQVEA